MSGQWTHPICDPCWENWQPGREAARFKEEFRETERCCWCGRETRSGIYTRHDPAELAHHRSHE